MSAEIKEYLSGRLRAASKVRQPQKANDNSINHGNKVWLKSKAYHKNRAVRCSPALARWRAANPASAAVADANFSAIKQKQNSI